MPLVRCPDCSRPVSDQATACPACGYPLAARADGGRRRSSTIALLVIATCLGIVGAICSFAAQNPVMAGVGITGAVIGTVKLVQVLVTPPKPR